MIKDSIYLKFKNLLPNKPYISNNLNSGLKITSKKYSFNKKYIQPNSPFEKNIMVFDIDDPNSSTFFIDKDVPPPNFMVLNKENGRSHYFYILEKGVYFSKNSSLKAQNYYNNVYNAFCQRLDADIGYSGLIAKNPLCSFWKTLSLTDHLYSLDELSKYCDFDLLRKSDPEKFAGLGRNCSLFDCLRFFAYGEIRRLKYNYKAFWNSCERFARKINERFYIPLSFNELKHIVKSVVKWCCSHFSEAGFSNFQKCANRRSQEVRKSKAEEKRMLATSLYGKGLSVKEICLEMNISKSSCYSYLP